MIERNTVQQAADPKAEFFAAMLKAKAAFKPLVKNRVNPHFRSKYADLAALHEAIDEALAGNGLLVMQPLVRDAQGVSLIRTRIIHMAGHEEAAEYVLPTGVPSQALAAAITYGRRNSLSSLLAIPADDDDDGEGEGHAPTQEEKRGKVYTVPAPRKPAVEVFPSGVPIVDEAEEAQKKTPPAPGGNADGDYEDVIIDSVSTKTGDKNGKTWTRYGIKATFVDGSQEWLNTFSATHGQLAERNKTNTMRVKLAEKEYQGKKQYDIIDLQEVANG